MNSLELIDKLPQTLEEDFYKRLLNGDIEKAKASSNYISNLILSIQNELVKITTNDENIKEDLANLRRELQEKFAEWEYFIEKELKGINDKDFEKDPGTWRSLLEDIFKEPTNELLSTFK